MICLSETEKEAVLAIPDEQMQKAETGRLQELIDSELIVGAEAKPDSPIQRVAIFTEAFLPKIDGVSRTTLLTIKYLQSTGREVLVFAPKPAISMIGTTQVIQIPSVGMPVYPETRVSPPWPFLLPLLKSFKPDLIHLFSPFGLGSMGMLAGGLLQVPVIANYQTDLPAYAQSYGYGRLSSPLVGVLRFLHNGCVLNLAPSASTLNELQQWGFHRLRIWGRGVDLDRFNPSRRHEAWVERLRAGRDPNRTLAIYVGRMARDKHIHVLHQLAQTPDIALTLIGSGSHQAHLQQLFSDTDAVFMGTLIGEDLACAYAAADVFVFPGPEETFGQVVLEAMASGLPVIITNRGGPQDMVTHGKTGFIVPVDDQQEFVAQVQALTGHPEQQTQMRRAARQFAESRPWIRTMHELEAHYAEALNVYQRFRRQHQRT